MPLAWECTRPKVLMHAETKVIAAHTDNQALSMEHMHTGALSYMHTIHLLCNALPLGDQECLVGVYPLSG